MADRRFQLVRQPRARGADAGICALLMIGLIFFPGTLASHSGLAQQGLSETLRKEFEAGVAAEKAGRLEEAERDFQSVLRQGGNIASVHSNLGTIYQQRSQQARAMAEFREAIRLEPNYAAPRMLLGASLLATGKVREAIRELEQAVKLAPKAPSARVELARAYERGNNLAGMVDQYRVLRELAPQDPEYAYQMGQAYLKLAQWCLEEMRRLDPQSSRVYESLAEAYRAQGHTDEAIHAYERAAEADPRLPGVHLALAQIYLQEGKTGDASREVELELSIVPESVAAKAVQQRIISAEAEP